MFVHYGVSARTLADGRLRVEKIRQAQEQAPAWPAEAPWQEELEAVLAAPGGALHRLDPPELMRTLDTVLEATSGDRMGDWQTVACYWYLTPGSTMQLSVMLPREDFRGETVLGVILSADFLSDAEAEIAEAGEALRRAPMVGALAIVCGSLR